MAEGGGGCRNARERLAKLKTEEAVLAKSCKASLNAIKMCDQRLAADIGIVAGELEEARKREKNKINRDVAEIYEEISAFQNLMQNDEYFSDHSPKKCKEKLMHIQNKIIKSRQYLEKEIFVLKNEEKALFEEVLLAQQRIEESAKFDTTQPVSAKHKFVHSKVAHSASSTNKDKDIETFEKFVEHHGHFGGWEEQDHLLFLRLRSRFQDQAKLHSALMAQLPDMESYKIDHHAEWYEEYESLREKNRVAIQKWREGRKKLQKRDSENETRRSSSASSADTEASEQKKLEIAEWKKQKQLLQEMKEQKKREELEAERAKQKLEREKQLKIKEEIDRRRQTREAAEREDKELMEMLEKELQKEKSDEARKMIKIYRQLDELHVEKQKLMRIKKLEKKAPPPVIDSLSVHAERDPDRLMQKTKVWQAKCKEDDEDKPQIPQPNLHLRNIPHLGVPEWRRGMN